MHPVQAQTTKQQSHETLLSSNTQSQMIGTSYSLSNNMRRIAYRLQEGKKQVVFVDTLRGAAYDSVSAPVFSPDSRHFAYAAKSGKISYLIVDHKQNLMLDSNNAVYSIQFSSDNKSLSYILYDGHNYYMVFHGVKGKPYDLIDENSITFTADGTKIAYSVTKNKKQAIVYNDMELPFYKEVGFPVLSNDGSRLAYWAKDGNVTYLITDGKKSQAFESVGSIQFSKDGKHISCQATRVGKYMIVLDGKESEMFQLVHSFTYSPDGNHFVYAMELYSDDKEAFYNYVIQDGVRKGPYETVVQGSFKYSNDGTELVFEAEKEDEFFIVKNGIEKAHYSDVMQASEIFSNNSQHFAYAAERLDTKRIANIDGVESRPYDDVYAIVFSPTSNKYVYSVKEGSHEFVVADGKDGGYYDSILGGGLIFFDSDNAFHYIAMKDKKIFLVEEKF